MASGSLDEVMDPLFDNDWLQEHNLDVLFDLFEEEIEGKDLVDGATTSSSSLFGTSPVTSYLFSASPSLASALDLYDWLYFENQQPVSSSPSQQPSSMNPTPPSQPTTNTASSVSSASLGQPATNSVGSNAVPNGSSSNPIDVNPRRRTENPITDAMRIKRKIKRGQSEGISLLARPLAINGRVSSVNRSSGGSGSNLVDSGGSSGKNTSVNIINQSNSDNISTKPTNCKRFLGKNCSSGPVSIACTKRTNCIPREGLYQHHLHYITGCAIVREHAYAVQGH